MDLAEAFGATEDDPADLEINGKKVTGEMAGNLAGAPEVPEHWLP